MMPGKATGSSGDPWKVGAKVKLPAAQGTATAKVPFKIGPKKGPLSSMFSKRG